MSHALCRPLSNARLQFAETLSSALTDYQPWGNERQQQRQDAYRVRMQALLSQGFTSGLDPTCRSHFEPGHFTCSAFVLDHSGERILLIAHKKLQLWLQPGGHVEASDLHFIDAARREVEEETALRQLELELTICDLDIHSIPPLGSEPAHEHYDLRVLYREKHPRQTEELDGDERAQFFELSKVVNASGILHEELMTDESVRRVCRQLEQRFYL